MGVPLTSSLRFSRAREKRGTCRTGRHFLFVFSFLSFSRCGAGEVRSLEVGVAGAVRAPRATGSPTNRSAESAARDPAALSCV
jgi:hypothetical protein